METHIIIKHLFFLSISFLGVYLIGHLLLSFFYKDSKDKLFQKLVIGVTILPFIYAVYKTNGVTVLSLTILIATIFIYHKRELITISSISSFWKRFLTVDKGFVATYIALIIFYFIQLNSMFDLSTGIPLAIDKDYSNYARVARYLRDFGIENRNIEYFLIDKGGVTIYHYTELWFSAFTSQLLNIHSQYALHLFVYPILLAVVYSGIILLISRVKSILKMNNTLTDNKLFSYITPYFFFTLSMFASLYPNNIELLKMDLWATSILSMPKLLYVYVYSICMVLFVLKEDYFSLSIVACLLSISYSAITPALFFAISLFFFYSFLFQKKSLKITLLNFYPLVITAISILIFYMVFGEKDGVTPSFLELINNYTSINAYQTFINIIGKTIIQIIITSSPIIILWLFLRKKINSELSRFLIFIVLSGVFFYAILHQMHDAIQLWANLYVPFVNIFAFVVLIIGLVSISDKKLIIPNILILVILFFGINTRFPFRKINNPLNMVNTSLLDDEMPKFAFIKEKEDYKDYYSNFDQVYAGATHTLMRKYDPLLIVCLSTHNINSENEKLYRFNKNATFEKYMRLLKEKDVYKNIEQAQINFIKEFEIDYLLSYKNRDLPTHFNTYFKNQPIGYVDGFSIHERIK